jgi:ribosomal subunit interface protein
MQLPVQITFRNLPHSEAVEAEIRERTAKLDTYYDRIMSCRVVVESPHQRRQQGQIYHIKIDLTVPGAELVIKREPGLDAAHEDLYVAIRDAFNAARRKLQDFARRQRRQVKRHAPAPRARVSKLFADEGYGFLETPDGREIYFHRHSVVNGDFEHLQPGTEVSFAEAPGEKGPQASAVKIAGRKRKATA